MKNGGKRTGKRYLIVGTLLLTVAFTFLFTACGKNDSKDSDKQKKFKVNTKKLEKDGYEKISDVAYIKAYGDDKDTIHIVYLKDEPVDAYVAYANLMSYVDDSTKIDIEWNKKRYVIDFEKLNAKVLNDEKVKNGNEKEKSKRMGEIMLSYLPDEWKYAAELFMPFTDSPISSMSDDVIVNDIKFYFENHVEEKKKEEPKADKEITKESKTDDDSEIIYEKSEKYTVDGENLLLTLKIEKDKTTNIKTISITSMGNCKTREKAVYMWLILDNILGDSEIKLDEYGIVTTVNSENLMSQYIKNKNNGSVTATGREEDGSVVLSTPKWAKETSEAVKDKLTSDEFKEYANEVGTALSHFFEIIGNDTSN